MSLLWHLSIIGLLHIIAGLNHFIYPRIYLKIIPTYLLNPKLLNQLIQTVLIILGLLLFIPIISSNATWEIIITVLSTVFSVNLFMLQDRKASFKTPKWILLSLH